MNKKVIFSVAAAAALLVSTPGVNKADAASNCPTPQKTNYSQTTIINADQINSMLQKYFKNNNIQWNFNKGNGQTVQKPQQPQQPEQVQKPSQQPPTQQQNSKPTQTPEQQPSTPTSTSVSEYEKKVVELTNAERAKYGVAALQLDENLSKVARTKSSDMKAKGYFDHNSPTYGSPFDMMKQFGISYSSAGENIAMGQRSPEEVVKAWMNSEGHRKNILNGSFTHIGVGYVADGKKKRKKS